MKRNFLILFLLILVFSFKKQTNNLINLSGTTVSSRFLVPSDFIREKVENNSFAHFLRELPLKKHGSEVYLYNKKLKGNQNAHIAVVDKSILSVDLQQCADAVIRCRAEYLYSTKQFDKISFNFTNGFKASYIKWREGYKINVAGNKVSWVKTSKPDTSYAGFNNYLKMVYNYCGSLSLSKQLKQKSFLKLEIGDVLLIGGSPGHAELVVDKVINPKTKEFKFLLLQSYMPAQEMQILKNNEDLKSSPWYSSNINFNISTPEYNFTKDNLYSFE
ncbi:MAG: DUF4846 domain-containing protein [Bacteroidetes bacterium]|nr:DUF4846 domain-containing protein [Bacteroidota bacterium]